MTARRVMTACVWRSTCCAAPVACVSMSRHSFCRRTQRRPASRRTRRNWSVRASRHAPSWRWPTPMRWRFASSSCHMRGTMGRLCRLSIRRHRSSPSCIYTQHRCFSRLIRSAPRASAWSRTRPSTNSRKSCMHCAQTRMWTTRWRSCRMPVARRTRTRPWPTSGSALTKASMRKTQGGLWRIWPWRYRCSTGTRRPRRGPT